LADITRMRDLCHDETIKTTRHFTDRLVERLIEYDDVISAIIDGEIIEEYPTAYPHPCALLLHLTTGDKPLHVVAGTDGIYLWLITAYHPTLDKWNSDYKTRKAVD